MKEQPIIVTPDDIANLQINNARELIISADVTRRKEEKIKSLILAIESIEKCLQALGVNLDKRIDVVFRKS